MRVVAKAMGRFLRVVETSDDLTLNGAFKIFGEYETGQARGYQAQATMLFVTLIVILLGNNHR